MGRNPDAFQSFVEAQLDSIQGTRFKRMFGGFGIYCDELFFGIIHGDRLYFHTNEKTKKRYEGEGMSPFITPGGKIALKHYYEVPLQIIEMKLELVDWAREAISTV
jgi:DNA transformation protein